MKNKSRLGKKVNQYKTNYNKEIGALLGLTICFLVMLGGIADYGDETYVAEPEVPVVKVTNVELTKSEIEEKIKIHFPRSWKDMIPVAYAESGLQPTAQNWNCYYNKDETIVYTTRVKGSHSTSCKKSHRTYAWSVDCGIMQMSHKAKTCPVETIDEHLARAAELSRIQGKNAWVAYQNKSYLAYTK